MQKTDSHDRFFFCLFFFFVVVVVFFFLVVFFFFFFFFFQKFVLVTSVMWTENMLLSRKGISWKQIDNLITQYEHE